MASSGPEDETQARVVCAFVSGVDVKVTAGAAAHSAERLFGFATFDLERRSFRICEFHEDTRLSRSEALLLQTQPNSCCSLLQDPDDTKKLGRIADSCGVRLSEMKSTDLKAVDIEQDLLRLLTDTGCGLSRHLEEQKKKQGMRALGALFAHHSLVSEPAHFGACSLSLYPLRSFMHLDKAAFSALNILPRPEDGLRSSTSLLGFMNRCRSDLGTRRLRQWLTQPLTSREEIEQRKDVVEALSKAENMLREIEGHLRHVPDLEKVAARFHRTRTTSKFSKATIEDMYLLYQCLVKMEAMLNTLVTYEGLHSAVMMEVIVAPLRVCLGDFASFRALVEKTIDLVQAEQRVYCISMAFDPALQQVGSQRDRIREQMEVVRKGVETELRNNGMASGGRDAGVSLQECPDGQCFRVTKKHQQIVQGYKGRYKLKILSIKKLEVMFGTSELDKLNESFAQAIKAYEHQSKQLADKALAVASTYTPVIEKLAELLGNIDALAALARVVLSAPCNFARAKVDPDGKTFEIQGAAHVLVVANSEKSFVANDLSMEKEASRLHIITGPNMGGKSTYIRSVALIVLLNQIGSFVPCSSATLPVFDSVMCRVGASDMQLRGISTFMAEMLEAASILNTATDRSLVIVDELGRGTSTSDGFGIAWAIARHLAEATRCFTLFATHFHEMAGLEDVIPGVHNRHATAAVDAASGRLTFLYALAAGAADQSYGAHVAELAGFPQRVVEAARCRATEFEANGAFGRAAKRHKTNNETDAGDASTKNRISYVMAAQTENDFVSRALEHMPQLQAASAHVSECGA